MDLLIIGHCTIDLHMKIDSASISQEGAKMCFVHGSKIHVDELKETCGGNAFNVAVGAETLGLAVGVYTELGDDEASNKIIKELRTHNVDTKFCVKNPKVVSNISAIISHGGERTIFSYHGKQKYSVKDFGSPKIIYYTSVPDGYENFQKELVLYMKSHPKTILAFNPGSIHLRNGVESFRNILEITDILIVNKEEFNLIKSNNSAKLTIVTEGKNGATSHEKTKSIHVDAYTDNKPITDKTGAGDAFASGFISAIFYGKPLKEALTWGVANAGSVIKEIGSTEGLLKKDQIEKIVRINI